MIKIKLSPSEWLKIAVLFVVFVGGSIASYVVLQPKRVLPIYNPSDLNPAVVDDDLERKGRGHRIGDFELVDQWGNPADSSLLQGKIYVADFFFTTCGSICPKMTTNLVEVQKAFINNPKVMLLSHTVFPETDNVSVLKEYASKNGVIDAKWNLVTGDKKQIYTMARKSYLAVKLGKPEELYDMVHTENFVLVDSKRRVRGFYDGTKKEDIERLIEDINFLCTQ